MDRELKQYFEAMEVRLAGMETRIMERVDARLDAVETRLKDFILEADRDLETRIVGEFWKWGRTSDMPPNWRRQEDPNPPSSGSQR